MNVIVSNIAKRFRTDSTSRITFQNNNLGDSEFEKPEISESNNNHRNSPTRSLKNSPPSSPSIKKQESAVFCPICSQELLSSDPILVNKHVDECLTKSLLNEEKRQRSSSGGRPIQPNFGKRSASTPSNSVSSSAPARVLKTNSS